MFTGQDYFPEIESRQMTMHLRARAGLRIETTQQVFAQVEDVVREVIPEHELEQILDNIGVPSINYNFAFSDGSFVSYNDGQMLISLKEEHGSVAGYKKRLREVLMQRFPDLTVYFQPADIITQILNFGVITPIDIQVSGRTRRRTWRSRRTSSAACATRRASWTCICSRSSTSRNSTWTWTGGSPRNSGSPSNPWRRT